MTDNNKSVPHENQFLDPPIKPHDRNDEPEVEIEQSDDSDMFANVEQAEGYKSVCRE